MNTDKEVKKDKRYEGHEGKNCVPDAFVVNDFVRLLMNIRIELIGYLAKSGLPNGYKGGVMEFADGTTLAQVLELLRISKGMSMLIAVNGRVPDESYILREGDIVQFAPPIAGG